MSDIVWLVYEVDPACIQEHAEGRKIVNACHESRYNYEFRDQKGGSFVCSGLSGLIIAKPPFPLSSPQIPQEDEAILLGCQFLIPDDQDELQLLLQRNRSLSDCTGHLELTVFLHENCNLRCVYCFQHFLNQKLRQDVSDNLLAFVDKRLPVKGLLDVHFYGGEPLLAWDVLTKLVDEFRHVTDAKQASFQFHVTTNGILLDPLKSEYLSAAHVSYVKITLDGPPEIHDARRKGLSGEGTFDAIVQNLQFAVHLLKVKVRVNLDRGNIQHAERLLDILAQGFPDRSNMYLDYNIVFRDDVNELESGVSYLDIYELQSRSLEKGFKLSLPPLARFRHCKFNSPNSYLVDTSGRVYLCSNTEQCFLGPIDDIIESKDESYHADFPKSEFLNLRNACVSCNMLPICAGGCTLLSLNKAHPSCPVWKQHLSDYLEIHYRNQQ